MKKIKYSRFLILGVFIYILFQGIVLLIGAKTSTVVMKAENYEMKTKERCLIIRDEYLVNSDIDGTLSTLVNENEKVKKSGEVAIIFNDEVDKNTNKEIEEINNEIKNLRKENNPLKSGIISSKEEQLKILQEQVKKNTSVFYATTSGVISYKYDKNEDKYSTSKLEDIDEKDIENASNNYITMNKNNKRIKAGSVIYRMINDNELFLAFVNEDNKLFNQGDSVKIKISDTEINGEIYKKIQKGESYVTIIKITQQNTGFYDTRVEEFDIIYKQMESLRIPKESTVTKDKILGAYVINEETKKPYFKEIKGISFEDDNYIYVDFRSNERDGIDSVDLHDRIILKPNLINTRIKVKN